MTLAFEHSIAKLRKAFVQFDIMMNINIQSHFKLIYSKQRIPQATNVLLKLSEIQPCANNSSDADTIFLEYQKATTSKQNKHKM